MRFLKLENNLIKVQKNNLNLNRDEINRFGAKTDPNKLWTSGANWDKSLRLKIRLKNISFWDKISHFSGLVVGEKEGEEERSPRLLSVLLGVSLVGIHRAKN